MLPDSFTNQIKTKKTMTSKYKELPDLEMDCPDPLCSGWMIGYVETTSTSTRPTFIKCSEKMCKLKTMMSKYDSRCKMCAQPISLNELICSSDTITMWVHARCLTARPEFFAICQRCTKPIDDEFAAYPTTCKGKAGYCHLSCSKKKRSMDDYDMLQSSQDSFPSVESVLSTPPRSPAVATVPSGLTTPSASSDTTKSKSNSSGSSESLLAFVTGAKRAKGK